MEPEMESKPIRNKGKNIKTWTYRRWIPFLMFMSWPFPFVSGLYAETRMEATLASAGTGITFALLSIACAIAARYEVE